MYAGFWLRFVACIIDGILLSIVYFILTLALGDAAGIPILLLGWLYFALMESSDKQATFGKMALGLHVTDTNGQRIGFGKATGRFFGKIISQLIIYIGYIMAGFTEKKQALHDIMAGCLVLRNSGEIAATSYNPNDGGGDSGGNND